MRTSNAQLYVSHHDSNSVTFVYESLNVSSHSFKLFFSYYEPYNDDELNIRNAGTYVFKTKNVKDSLKYPHKIVKIECHRNSTAIQYFVIAYEDEVRERSFVKVKLRDSSQPIEFDVHFSGLTQHDMDGIINFESLNISNLKGTFYTDSNGLGIVKRTKKKLEDDSILNNFLSDAPANYYPINKCLMIEDRRT